MPLLHRRYRIQRTLGERRLATTLLAVDEHTGRPCVVKRLSLRRAFNNPIPEIGTVAGSDTGKLVELFEREGRVLSHLDHPRIPRFVEQFTIRTSWDTELYLVQEYIDAPSLAAHMASGRHFTEREVVQIGIQMAEILEYLHGRSPPLIHRDIKPSNILFDSERGAFLIDFGVVKNRIATNTLEGGTVVGTFDYMPLEQYHGNAVPTTDIYSLGMTLIAVLSHLEPSDLTRQGSAVEFRPHVQVSDRFGRVLDRMVHALPERRYPNAARLKRDLMTILGHGARQPRHRVVIAAALTVLSLTVWSGVAYTRARSTDKQTELTSTGPTAIEAPLIHPEHLGEAPPPVVPAGGELRMNLIRDFLYVDKGWPLGLSARQSSAAGPDVRPYETLRREPSYASSQPRYGYLPLGNSADDRVTYVIDEIERPNWVLYVDANNNEDLTDDGPPYQNEGTGRLAANVKLTIDVINPDGTSAALPYRLWFWVRETPTLAARFYARCHYAARIDVDGTLYEAVAYELDRHNGLFRENGVWIDLNRDGKLDEAEHFDDGSRVTMGGAQYQIHLDFP